MENLDFQQKKAVMTESVNALILAGAGSGKTRTMIERVAYLIEHKQVSPYEIICMTFTRKAAQEIKERLALRIGEAKAYKITAGTIHSIALHQLRRFGEQVGLKPDALTVYGQWEEDMLVKDTAGDMGLFKNSWKIPKKVIDTMFMEFYQKGLVPDEECPAYNLFKAVMGRCREDNALTYGGLLIAFKEIIKSNKFFGWKHLLVDEVQDIDTIQWEIIDLLKEYCKVSLFAVGDISQSIYSFRGAIPDKVEADMPKFDVYTIATNYRSAKDIVEAANKLIILNTHPVVDMLCFRDSDEKSRAIHKSNMDSDAIAGFIADMMPCAKPEKLDLSNIAILARNHFLLEKLSWMLAEHRVPFNYLGKKTKVTQSEAFVRYHSFLKLLVNPYDNFSFMLVAQSINLNRGEYLRIREVAAKEGLSHFQSWIKYGEENAAMKFFTMETGFNVETAFRYIYNNFRIPATKYELEMIESFVTDWTFEKGSDIREYLDWLAVYDAQDEITRDNVVTICTIHAAKGLEWPTVILAGFNEELIPSLQAIKSGYLEEERRLAYVGYTRAKDQLLVTSRPIVTVDGKGKEHINPVSRFVYESRIIKG